MDRHWSACWAPFLENTRLGEPSTHQDSSKTCTRSPLGCSGHCTRRLLAVYREGAASRRFIRVAEEGTHGAEKHGGGGKESFRMQTEGQMGHAHSRGSRECCQVPRKCPGISREWPDLRHMGKGPPGENQNHMGGFLVNFQTCVSWSCRDRVAGSLSTCWTPQHHC